VLGMPEARNRGCSTCCEDCSCRMCRRNVGGFLFGSLRFLDAGWSGGSEWRFKTSTTMTGVRAAGHRDGPVNVVEADAAQHERRSKREGEGEGERGDASPCSSTPPTYKLWVWSQHLHYGVLGSSQQRTTISARTGALRIIQLAKLPRCRPGPGPASTHMFTVYGYTLRVHATGH
jgi:hypothetical protein